MLKKVVSNLLFPIERVTIAGDSMCAILALLKDGISFKTFFQNRICEVHENLQEAARRVKVVEPVLKIEGKINPIDICTRPSARAEELGSGSVWQKGPSFLLADRPTWPLTQVTGGEGIPKEELKEVKKCRKKFNKNGC